MQIFGSNGTNRCAYVIDRSGRDLPVARVHDGSSEVQRMVTAEHLRKGDVETAM